MAEIIGNTLIKLKQVDSTNNYATAHMSINNWNEGTVVMADEQINGRGQMKNTWESEPGANLLLSIVLYPDFLPVQYQFLLSKVVTLGLHELLSAIADDVKIKWPNDLYIGTKKVAGILIENSIMGHTLSSSVIGVGLNVNQLEFKSDAPNPVSMRHFTGKKLEHEKISSELFNAIDFWYCKLRTTEEKSILEIDAKFEQNLYRKDIVASYKDSSGVYNGVLKGVNEIGQLMVQAESGELRAYHFKEVEFL